MAAGRGGDSGQLRIIGGRWRGRKFRFRAAPGLRPTPDRVRETLFNWLAARVPESRCLDLFAGSGALGLEALSRGAAWVCFVDRHGNSIKQIDQHLAALQARNAECRSDDALQLLKRGNPGPAWDIVFLDPPFDAGLLAPAARLLEEFFNDTATTEIYTEQGVREPAPEMPPNWELHREKNAGDVRFSLFVRSGQFV
jgi:16S rRNA (guanine966-N2)-methyltransferase